MFIPEINTRSTFRTTQSTIEYLYNIMVVCWLMRNTHNNKQNVLTVELSLTICTLNEHIHVAYFDDILMLF